MLPSMVNGFTQTKVVSDLHWQSKAKSVLQQAFFKNTAP
jgi:hypothetical protein